MSRINRVIDILIRRDGLSYEEAKEELDYVRELCDEAISAGDYFEVEDIIADELGLEPDYIFDILDI